eukprot:gene7018-biopygen20975
MCRGAGTSASLGTTQSSALLPRAPGCREHAFVSVQGPHPPHPPAALPRSRGCSRTARTLVLLWGPRTPLREGLLRAGLTPLRTGLLRAAADGAAAGGPAHAAAGGAAGGGARRSGRKRDTEGDKTPQTDVTVRA